MVVQQVVAELESALEHKQAAMASAQVVAVALASVAY